MRALLLVPDTVDRPMGGMGEQLRGLLEGAKGMEVSFDVVCASRQEPRRGVNHQLRPIAPRETGSMTVIPAATGLLDQLPFFEAGLDSKNVPDLVHAFDWSTFLPAVQLSRRWQVPLVVTIQLSWSLMIEDLGAEHDAVSQVNANVEFDGMRYASAIIQVSEAYARRMPSVFDHKTFIVGNGVNLAEFADPDSYVLPGTRPVKVVYLGRFCPQKNIAAMLHAELPDSVDLIFVGGSAGSAPPLHDAVIAAAAARDNVHYLGPKYGREKAAVLGAADAVLMPSMHEPFGIVALEAMAAGAVLLSSFKDGLADFLTEACAVNCGTTPQSISAALGRLVEMPDAERSAICSAGAAVAARYDWRSQATRLVSVYRRLVSPPAQVEVEQAVAV